MRSLNRNKRNVYYALFEREEPIKDEYGNETSESKPIYGNVIALKCNVSGASGEDAVQAFGNFTNYTRVMCISDNACPIDENSVIWFGIEPTEPYNHIVTRKADSKNGILYALKKVR